uniref:Uncharacterized protein n=1 Tax=Dictyoglomus turgidum TaxID=513050 RepID=A0A7C3WM50_9BACT
MKIKQFLEDVEPKIEDSDVLEAIGLIKERAPGLLEDRIGYLKDRNLEFYDDDKWCFYIGLDKIQCRGSEVVSISLSVSPEIWLEMRKKYD